jgi:cytidylate kinase
VTRALLDAGARPDDAGSVELALGKLRLGSVIAGVSSSLTLDGRQPADATLRTEDVNATVSRFAALPAVRAFLLAYQRSQVELARAAGFAGVIMEGRDIGSVVLPQAEVRLFLQADPVARAQRRAAEGQADAVAQRDLLDSTRAAAPMVCPEGATRLDNTHLPLAEVVAQVKTLVQTAARLG